MSQLNEQKSDTASSRLKSYPRTVAPLTDSLRKSNRTNASSSPAGNVSNNQNGFNNNAMTNSGKPMPDYPTEEEDPNCESAPFIEQLHRRIPGGGGGSASSGIGTMPGRYNNNSKLSGNINDRDLNETRQLVPEYNDPADVSSSGGEDDEELMDRHSSYSDDEQPPPGMEQGGPFFTHDKSHVPMRGYPPLASIPPPPSEPPPSTPRSSSIISDFPSAHLQRPNPNHINHLVPQLAQQTYASPDQTFGGPHPSMDMFHLQQQPPLSWQQTAAFYGQPMLPGGTTPLPPGSHITQTSTLGRRSRDPGSTPSSGSAAAFQTTLRYNNNPSMIYENTYSSYKRHQPTGTIPSPLSGEFSQLHASQMSAAQAPASSVPLLASNTAQPVQSFSKISNTSNSSSDPCRKLSWKIWALLLLCLAAIVLLGLVIYFAAKSEHLDKKLEEKFAQDPAIMGLFDPDKPPQKIFFNRSVNIQLGPMSTWTGQFLIPRPQFMSFRFTISRHTRVGLFLRQNSVPTVVQYNHFEKISGALVKQKPTKELSRQKRAATYGVNNLESSLIIHLEKGLWFISMVNDLPREESFSLNVAHAPDMKPGCQNACSKRGICRSHGCDCSYGYKGPDCSIEPTPVVCNDHGSYKSGVCHCYPPWKGPECEVLWSQCLDSTCSGKGRCVAGECQCYSGYEGQRCQTISCPGSNCSGHGVCQSGKCRCFAGWSGAACDESVRDDFIDQTKSCSERGKVVGGKCQCYDGFSGSKCEEGPCPSHCAHGSCNSVGFCICQSGWEGSRCNRKTCDKRCFQHGTCVNGECKCSVGWHGKHCTLDGCPQNCSNHGSCVPIDESTPSSLYHCRCESPWKGAACDVRRELVCNDTIDNDNDGLVDCKDPDCCVSKYCEDLRSLKSTPNSHVSSLMIEAATQGCSKSDKASVFLLSTKVARPGSSFKEQLNFLFAKGKSQIVGNNLHPERVSVVRGVIRQWDGTPMIGCRISDKNLITNGYTLTGEDGEFDLLVQGGYHVKLEFSRYPTERFQEILNIYVPANDYINIGDYYLVDKKLKVDRPSPGLHMGVDSGRRGPHMVAGGDCGGARHNPALLAPNLIVNEKTNENVPVCLDQADVSVCVESGVLIHSVRLKETNLHLLYRSSRVSGYKAALHVTMISGEVPEGLQEVHLWIDVAGQHHTFRFEADPMLTYTFHWNRTDAYLRKMYGITPAKVFIGYKYKSCPYFYWERKVALLTGYDLTTSDIGHWNLDIRHLYDHNHGVVYRGDGSHLYLTQKDWQVTPITEIKKNALRPVGDCTYCSAGTPSRWSHVLSLHSLVSDGEGNLLLGDGGYLRVLRKTIDKNNQYSWQFERHFNLSFLSGWSSPNSEKDIYPYYITWSSVGLSAVESRAHQVLAYVSDPEGKSIWRIKYSNNEGWVSTVFIGSSKTGHVTTPCIDEPTCTYSDSFKNSHRLKFPKGIAVNLNGDIFFADYKSIKWVNFTMASYPPHMTVETLIGGDRTSSKWRPMPCGESVHASEFRVRWPTSLRYNPVDNSIYFIDINQVFRLCLETYQVTLVAGYIPSCPRDERFRSEDASLFDSPAPWANQVALPDIRDIAISPLGELYIASATLIWKVPADGRLYRFAGSTKVCPESGQWSCSNSEGSFDKDFQFSDITAIAVYLFGEVIVADNKHHAVYQLFYDLPKPIRGKNDNIYYRVVSRDTQEVYWFNKDGQHVETDNAITGTQLHQLEFSANSFNGWLASIKNNVHTTTPLSFSVHRDSKSKPVQLETPTGFVYNVTLDSASRIISLTSIEGSWDFQYDSSDLLVMVRTPGDKAPYRFEYHPISGRLVAISRPSGGVVKVDESQSIGGFGRKSLNWRDRNLQIKWPGTDQSLSFTYNYQPKQSSSFVVQYLRRVLIVKNKIPQLSNEIAWIYKLSNKSLSISAMNDDPYAYPDDNRRLTRESKVRYDFNSNSNNWAAASGKTLMVNGEIIFKIQYNVKDLKEIYSTNNVELFEISYNLNSQPIEYKSYQNSVKLNLIYTRYSLLDEVTWGGYRYSFSYDHMNRSSKIVLPSKDSILYSYDSVDSLLPSEITVKSLGNNYRIIPPKNNDHATPSRIITPVNQELSLLYVTGFATRCLMFKPWRQLKSYWLYEFDVVGRLRRFSYPSGHRSIHFRYTSAGTVKEVFAAGLHVKYLRDDVDSQLVMKVLLKNADSGLTMKTRYKYIGRLISQVDSNATLPQGSHAWSADAQLKVVRFRYTYDANFRVVNMVTRVGTKRQMTEFQYNTSTGALTRVGDLSMLFLSGGAQLSIRLTTTGRDYILDCDHYGRMKKVEYLHPDNKRKLGSAEFVYLTDGRVSELKLQVVNSPTLTLSYVYDSVVHRLKTLSINHGDTFTVEYSNNRVFKLNTKLETALFYYDNRGLIRSINKTSGPTTSFTFDDDGLLLDKTLTSTGQQTFRQNFYYTGVGALSTVHMTQKHHLQYLYDANQRLIAIQNLLKGNNATQFFYGDVYQQDRVSHIYIQSSNSLWTLHYEPRHGRLFGVENVDKKEFNIVLCNVDNSPMVVINSSGSLIWQATYDIFGARKILSRSDGDGFSLPIGYKGGVHDDVTGLVYLDNRWYDTESHHFISAPWSRLIDRLKHFKTQPSVLDLWQLHQMEDAKDVEELSSPEFWLKKESFVPDLLLPRIDSNGIVNDMTADYSPLIHDPMNKLAVASAYDCIYDKDSENFQRLKTSKQIPLAAALRSHFYWPMNQFTGRLGPIFGSKIVIDVDLKSNMPPAVNIRSKNSDAPNWFKSLLELLFSNSRFVPISKIENSGDFAQFFVKTAADDESSKRDVDIINGYFSLGNRRNVKIEGRQVNVTLLIQKSDYLEVEFQSYFLRYFIRYYSTSVIENDVSQEENRLNQSSQRIADSLAWSRELNLLTSGRKTSHSWTDKEKEELMERGRVSGYTTRALYDLSFYPELLADPSVYHFIRT